MQSPLLLVTLVEIMFRRHMSPHALISSSVGTETTLPRAQEALKSA